MQPTPEQSDAIHISDKNLIVVAGAGSGKTRVLVERFLQRLEENPDWRINSLVAVTFTREAAFEMRHRLRQELERRRRQASGGPWARHLAQLDSARIDTIHGLCADLLRANAAQAGIDPEFEVLDENDSAILLGDIVYDALAAIEAPLSRLFAHYDSFKIDETLRNLNLVNAEYAPVPAEPEALFELWQGEWRGAVFEARRQLLDCDERAAIASLGAPPANDKLSQLFAQYEQYFDEISQADDASAAIQLMRECHQEGAVGTMGRAAAWGGKEAKAFAAQLLRDFRDKIKIAIDAIGEPPADIDRATAEMLPLWHQLLQQVKTAYQQQKRAKAQLDFDDLERLAAELLQQDELRKRYRRAEFKHLLVDEFQDSNAAQWQIVSSLADLRQGGTLFVVGDPKQSIYQFRGADVSVFNQVRDQIAKQAAGRALSLSTSFRSHQPLVDQFNALFSEILVRDESSPAKDFQVVYGKAMQALRPEAPALPAITVQLLEAEERDEAGNCRARPADDMRRWEAYEIAAHIKRMVAEGRPVFDKETGQTRGLAYRDAAILFQSMSKLTLYEDVFKAQALPYLTIAGRGYFDRQEVWDMLDLLRFLHNPADSLSLAAVLRSPIFAFSDDLLFALRLPSGGSASSREPLPLWLALQKAAEQALPSLAEPDLPAVCQALACLQELLQAAGRVTISELLRLALARTNYLAILTGLPDGDRRRGNVEKLLQLAEDSGKITLGKFSRYLSDLSTREAREGEALLEPGEAVRLMTVHASKGLEFPLVILANAAWERGSGREPIVRADPEFGLSCRVYSADSNKYESGFAQRRNKKRQALQEAAERRRLLYVAATRAQDYLMISGNVKQTKQGDWSARGWLKLLLPALDLKQIERQPTQLRPFAGYPIQLLMPPAPPPPPLLQPRASAADTLWDFSPPGEGYAPFEPPLMQPLQPLKQRHARGPRHISASQIAHLGARLHGLKPSERRQYSRRYRAIASTGMSESDYESTFEPRNWQRLIGRIMHEILRYVEFSSSAAPSADMIGSIAWEMGLRNAAALRSAGQEIGSLLQAYRGSLAQRWIMDARAAKSPLYTELPFMMRRGARVIHGLMDVLLRRGDGEWTVIDYKTSQVAAGNFAEYAKRYRMQLGIYALAAKEQLGLARPPLTYVHFIRGNQLIELSREDCQRDLNQLESMIGELAKADAEH